jgi:hypothetical protein
MLLSLSAVPDGRRHGHFPEMWQFYKLDVCGKLVVVVSNAVRQQLMTPSNIRKAGKSRDVGNSKDPSSNRNTSFKQGTPAEEGTTSTAKRQQQQDLY